MLFWAAASRVATSPKLQAPQPPGEPPWLSPFSPAPQVRAQYDGLGVWSSARTTVVASRRRPATGDATTSSTTIRIAQREDSIPPTQRPRSGAARRRQAFASGTARHGPCCHAVVPLARRAPSAEEQWRYRSHHGTRCDGASLRRATTTSEEAGTGSNGSSTSSPRPGGSREETGSPR